MPRLLARAFFSLPSLFWLEKMNPDANTPTISPENPTSEPGNCHPEFRPGIEQGGSVPGDPLPPLSSPDTPEWPGLYEQRGFPRVSRVPFAHRLSGNTVPNLPDSTLLDRQNLQILAIPVFFDGNRYQQL